MDDLFYGKFEIAVAEESDAVNPLTGCKFKQYLYIIETSK
jgi:hypothetical protein